MKRLLLVWLILGIMAAGLLYAGVKNVEDETGQFVVTLSNVDSDTVTSTKFLMTIPAANKVFDVFLGQVFLPDGVGTDTAIGNTDTLIITWKAGWQYYTQTMQVDTLFPPCTSFFEYYNDIGLGTAGTILGDSTAVLYPVQSKSMLFMNNIWFDAVYIDSAGDGDTVTATLQYFLRKVEK